MHGDGLQNFQFREKKELTIGDCAWQSKQKWESCNQWLHSCPSRIALALVWRQNIGRVGVIGQYNTLSLLTIHSIASTCIQNCKMQTWWANVRYIRKPWDSPPSFCRPKVLSTSLPTMHNFPILQSLQEQSLQKNSTTTTLHLHMHRHTCTHTW